MRKPLLFIFLILTVLAACKKSEDDVFSASPDTRLNDTLKRYQEVLTSAPHGWKALLMPKGFQYGVFSFYFRFNDSGRVQMFADFDSTSAVTMKESSYRLKALQQPSLLFDTYSYIHLLSDPDAAVNGGVYGEGLYSDFEFSMDAISGDSIMLTGRYHGSKAILVKATEAEEAAWYNNKDGNHAIDNMGTYLTYFKRFNTGTKNYDIAIDVLYRTATFSWIDAAGGEHTQTTGFYYTPGGIGFYPAVNDSIEVIASFDNITWSPSTTTLSFTVNGNAGTIKETAKPLVVDKAAPLRWWQTAVDSYVYWQSETGFHINGVDDAYGIQTLPNYYLLLFYPQYGTSSGTKYDLLAIVTNATGTPGIDYGPAFKAPTYTADGRLVLSYLGNYNSPAFPADATPVTNTRTLLADPNGFYLVQTGPYTYDMVSAKDGKAWISWN